MPKNKEQPYSPDPDVRLQELAEKESRIRAEMYERQQILDEITARKLKIQQTLQRADAVNQPAPAQAARPPFSDALQQEEFRLRASRQLPPNPQAPHLPQLPYGAQYPDMQLQYPYDPARGAHAAVPPAEVQRQMHEQVPPSADPAAEFEKQFPNLAALARRPYGK